MTAQGADLIEIIAAAFLPEVPEKIAVAVSGGGDSMALLYLLSQWTKYQGIELAVVTVDHGLRTEAAQEAEFVAGVAAHLGHSHVILKWDDWDGSGNLQDRARQARYRLISQWANVENIRYVALGHTLNDVAETFVMRLARQSGIDGLSAMRARRFVDGVTFVRPMLEIGRDALRTYLMTHNHTWVEDPSNDDLRFERVRVRRSLDTLAQLGIGREVLSAVAQNLTQAREALDWHCFLMAKQMVTIDHGSVILDRKQFRSLHGETVRRILVRSLCWVASTSYGPRRVAVERLISAVKLGKGMTLHGCHVTIDTDSIRIFREYKAVKDHIVGAQKVWDQRWQLLGPKLVGGTLRPLGGEGLEQCPDWRAVNRASRELIVTPALWRGDVLISAPMAGFTGEWQIELIKTEDDFFSSLMTH